MEAELLAQRLAAESSGNVVMKDKYAVVPRNNGQGNKRIARTGMYGLIFIRRL